MLKTPPSPKLPPVSQRHLRCQHLFHQQLALEICGNTLKKTGVIVSKHKPTWLWLCDWFLFYCILLWDDSYFMIRYNCVLIFIIVWVVFVFNFHLFLSIFVRIWKDWIDVIDLLLYIRSVTFGVLYLHLRFLVFR